VSVSIDTTLSELRPVVQRSGLDPRFIADEQVQLLGDASGGSATLRATIPAGYAPLWGRVSILIDDSPAITTGWWNFSFANSAFYQSAIITPVDIWGVASVPELPRDIDFDWTVSSYVEWRSANPDGDTTFLRVHVALWDIVDARQIPQNFFWPYALR